jgi:hypothetical protein
MCLRVRVCVCVCMCACVYVFVCMYVSEFLLHLQKGKVEGEEVECNDIRQDRCA